MINKDEKNNAPINVSVPNIIKGTDKLNDTKGSEKYFNGINNNYDGTDDKYYSYLKPTHDKNNFESQQDLNTYQKRDDGEEHILKKLDNNDGSYNFFNMLNNNYDGANDQYYSYLKSLYDKNNFELQQDLNAYQNKDGEDEQRIDENNDLYKLRIESVRDLQKIKKNKNIIMNTDHNEEFLCVNNNENNIYIIIILFILLIFLL